ncbi:MAG: clan AA aspartic protease [Thermoprotei archaeon]|nr:MAG: clan AA aspartic protease [Thermoprotei archaeon]
MREPYSTAEDPPVPVLVLKVYSPYDDKSLTLTFKVDTGFAGGILVPYDIYLKLELMLAEEPYPLVGRFVTGNTIKLYRAFTKIELENKILYAYVYSSPYIRKKLVGREILNKLKILLDGPQQVLEVLNSSR